MTQLGRGRLGLGLGLFWLWSLKWDRGRSALALAAAVWDWSLGSVPVLRLVLVLVLLLALMPALGLWPEALSRLQLQSPWALQPEQRVAGLFRFRRCWCLAASTSPPGCWGWLRHLGGLGPEMSALASQ